MAITIEQQLADARSAYHSLMTGTMARVVVDQNGERVEFAAANAAKLYAYIQSLESQLPSTTPPYCGGPATFTF